MTQLLTIVSSAPAWLAYLVIGLLAFVESAAFIGLVFPGEAALLLGGVLAGTGHLSLPILLIVAVAAAVLGDSAGYEIGRLGGDTIKASRLGRLIGDERWAKADAFTRKHGVWAVVAGRWIGLMRALVPAMAGMTLMPYRKFLVFNAIGGALWATAVVVGGYFTGTSWHQLESALGDISIVAVGAAALSVVAFVALRRRASAHGQV
ncbi:DedA family protein [Actinoplanes sp. NPDC000266]